MKGCQVMGIIMQGAVKTQKKIKNKRTFTFQAFMKKANHLTRFDD